MDRYPALSGRHQVDKVATVDPGDGSTESLEYLFNPDTPHAGKQSYNNVTGLLTIDDEGYYSYDSAKNAAEFDKDTNSFNVYNRPNKNGQFFPFNKAPEVMTLNRDDPKMNHYFGATITTRFVQQNNGHTDIRETKKTTFEFSGDDDVWIFIDDVLIGDVGGIHDKASVSINFATGAVEVVVIGGNSPITTTLKQCYEAAGKYDPTKWDGEIYKDNTVHTLKFFYLERGNYDSNMKLRYNLTAIPQTAIYKKDQYGKAVENAKFAVYAANENYQMLDNKGGSPVSADRDTGKYDADGNMIDGSGKIIANALYTGITNAEGEMVFLDDDSMPYSINELQDMFGNQFILREIEVPNGYRVVNKDVQLYIWEGQSQKILRCANTEQSGSRAAPKMQITATDTLYFQNGQNSVQYCDAQGNVNGTLFAVVYRYIGAVDENGNATQVNDPKKWVPIYGSDEKGYQMIETNDKEPGLSEALEAARQANDYGGDIVFGHSHIGTMQLTLTNLPGKITTYYHMLGQNQKEQARYTVAYYWTERTLDEATTQNTHQIDSDGGTYNGNTYSSFELVYGADIQVPNLVNRVFVQKVDEENQLIDGATFAIYEVEQSADGKIKYRSGDGSYHELSGNEVVSADGVITDGVTIKPIDTDVTRDLDDKIHTAGTAEFTNLAKGQYIIKEVNPPFGYKLNETDIMVLVTEDTIYANAGTEKDGVTVGRGPGYLVKPLSQLASEGEIDNTLTWIYAQMQISEPSTSFADAVNKSNIKGYISTNNSAETATDESEIFKTYLKYKEDNVGKAFNYVQDPDRNKGLDSDGYRRIFTTVGWPYYEIYQDTKYGKEQVAKKQVAGKHTNYNDWSGHELTNLFSRSTYIRVTDEHEPTLKLKKVDANNTKKVLSGAKFKLYKLEDVTGKKLYYCRDSVTQKIGWSENENEAFIITTGDDGMSDNDFIGMPDGVYYLEEIDSPEGYCKLSKPLEFTLAEKTLTLNSDPNKKIAEIDDAEKNKNTYTITVYNYLTFVLPATGGSGTRSYTLVGIMLMAVPLAYLCIKNCRLKFNRKN